MSSNTHNLLLRAIKLQQSGELLAAQDLYERILKKTPKDVTALNFLGVTYIQTGAYTKALSLLRKAVAIAPDYADAYNNLGIALRDMQCPNDAMACYRKALSVNPDYAEAHYNLGNVLQELQRPEDAIVCYRKALSINPRYIDAHNNLGNALKDLKQLEEARACYYKVLSIQPDHQEACINLGNTMRELEQSEEAIPCFRKALSFRPHDADLHHNLGIALQKSGHLSEAIDSYQNALSINPNLVDAHYNLGLVLQEVKRPEDAMACYHKVFSINPDHAEAHNALGNALKELDRLEEAVSCYRKVLSINMDFAEAHCNLGNVLQELKRPMEAIDCYQKSLSIKPDCVEAQWNQSHTFLAMGQFQQGWQDYETRWQQKEMLPLPATPYPCWLGELPITGKKLLIQMEQGFGDTLQMLRYIPLLQKQGIECWIQAPPFTRGLITRSFPGAHIIDEPYPPGMDYRIPLMSLPLAMHTFSEQDIPAMTPYLAHDPVRAAFWKTELARPSFSRTIGVTWRGRPTHRNDRNRSIPLADLLPLIAAHPSVQFVSLQKDLTEAEHATLDEHRNVRILDTELTNFDETAAVMSSLDLVISIDSAPAHLAGALAKPVWILLPWHGEWRWLMDRPDSPWYPTATLFRQKTAGDWARLINNVSASLADYNN